MMNLVVLCDFDGTVTDVDTCTIVLERFTRNDWKAYEEQFERGKLTLEECLSQQFSTVRATKQQILKEAEEAASIRSGFDDLVEYCNAGAIPLIIVSAGLDFVIRSFLERHGWSGFIQVYAPKAIFTSTGIKFLFPKLFDPASSNFKDDLVAYYKRLGKRVAYIGDGRADFSAAKNAYYLFAIRGSKLTELLKKEGIPHMEIEDFHEVVNHLKAEEKTET